MQTSLQAERLAAGFIQAGANVIFDSPIYSEGAISYDSATGEITINQIGTFVIQWLISVQASFSTIGSVFGVQAADGGTIIGNSPIKTGETVGFAVVRVDTTPVVVTLVNESAAVVWYSAVTPIKSSIVVFRSSGLEHLVDGNTVGSLAGIGTYFDYVMGEYAVALGYLTRASGNYALAEGWLTTASGLASHAEGYNTTASAQVSHAEGGDTAASADGAHAEGFGSIASGPYSHAEGDNTSARDVGSHSEGMGTIATGRASHAENGVNNAIAQFSHAEGILNISSGPQSHAEGILTNSSGNASHSEGFQTTTGGFIGAHIMGTYGDAEMNYSWFLANGSIAARGLAAKILTTGEAFIDQNWNGGGADYAEMFESADGTAIEPGYFVTFDDSDGEKIRLFNAAADNYVLGVTSATPAFLSNAGELRWEGKYLTDEWGRIQFTEIEIPDFIYEPTGMVIIPAHTETKPVFSPEFDPTVPYVPRSQRPEWVRIGLLGKLRVRDDGSCIPGGYCRPGENGIAVSASQGYRVLRRTGAEQVMILLR